MKKQILLFLALIMSVVASAQVTIQMEKEGGVYKVPCTVNGVKMKFIFDTGASTVCISQSMAQFLLDGDYLSVDDIVGTGQSQVADGSIVNHVEIILRNVEIGGMHIHNVEATVIEGQNAPLLLGQTAISELGRISIEGDKLLIHAADNGLSQEQINQLSEQTKRYLDAGSYAAAIENLITIDEAIGLSENQLISLCNCYYQNLQYEQCIQSGKRWINEHQKTCKNDGNKEHVFCLIAWSYFRTSDYNNALLFYQKSLDIIENGNLTVQSIENGFDMYSVKNEEGRMLMKAERNMNIGFCYYMIKNYSKALPYYQSSALILSRCLKVSLKSVQEGMVQDNDLGQVLYLIAYCYYELNNHTDADEMWKLSALCGYNDAIKICSENNLNYKKRSKKTFEWWKD